MRLLSLLGLVLALSQPLSPQPSTDAWPPRGVHALRDAGIVPPRILSRVRPKYTPAGRRAKIEGAVLLECVVGADGRVGAVRVTRSLDKATGLDDEAVKALKEWRFAPGTKNRVPVPVLVSVELSFSLGDEPAPLGLPQAFSSDSTAADGTPAGGDPAAGSWQEKIVDASGLRITVAYPPGWTVRETTAADRVLLLQSQHGSSGRTFEIRRPLPMAFQLTEPIGAVKLQQFAELVGGGIATSPGSELLVWGQAVLSMRLWVWLDVWLPPPTEQIDGFHVWTFTATEGGRLIQVACSVVMPRGSGREDTDAETRSAGGAFVEMLKRIAIKRLE